MTDTNTAAGASPAFLALACVGFIASAPAMAAPRDAAPADEPQQSILVEGKRVKTLESPKATAEIIDTPQTITVVSDQVIRKQNLQTLRDILQTVPGITFGAGEGGGGYGDSINLRGYSASNDITIDGIRDSAQYSRTDPFNLQQIEVYNGANSVFNGSGSVGGTINLVSKLPTPEDLTIVQGSVGTDAYYRGAIDANRRVTDTVGVRLNAAYHHNDVPGRDVEKYERWGVAPSVTIGLGTPTSLTLSLVHQRDDNTPIFGLPYFDNGTIGGFLPGTDRSDYYGYRNIDRQETTVDRFTATFAHAVNPHVSVRNLTRWQRVGQDTVTDAPQGTFCLAGTNRQPTGAPCTTTLTNVVDGSGVYRTAANPLAITVPAGFWLPSGPRGVVRDQENQLLANQTDIRLDHGAKGGIRNVANIGVQMQVEDYAITSGSLLRNTAGQSVVAPLLTIVDPDTLWTGPVNRTITGRSRATTRNVAVYAFDTLELGRMFELNGGVRWEYQHAEFRALPLSVVPPGSVQLTALQQVPQVSRERLFSYRVGAVFHPVTGVSVYGGYGNARTPSSATVRLGCGALATQTVGGVSTLVDPCAVAPETAKNYEAGVKAALFDGRLEATAAVFRNERTNYRVASNDPLMPTVQVLDGHSRVDGIALGLSGTIVPAWTIFANYTYLDSEVRQSVSDFCLRNPGRTGCGNTAANPDPQRGARLVQTPEHSGSLFTTWRLPFGLEVGYGLTYQGSFTTYVPNLANATTLTVDDYLIHRAYLGYTIGSGWSLQLNVQNLTDEKYVTNVRNNIGANGVVSGGWAMPGDRRQAVLSVFKSF